MIKKLVKTMFGLFVVTALLLFSTNKNISFNKFFIENDVRGFFIREGFQNVHETSESRNRTGILLDTCVLKKLDPWEPDINKYSSHDYNSWQNCNKTVEMAANLENGKLYLLDQRENVTCWWQCLFPKDDHTFTKSPWKKLINGSVPECDIVETTCGEKQSTDVKKVSPDDSGYKTTMFYEFLHAQVYRKDAPQNLTKTLTSIPPDVHIILFDSTSDSHFTRAMPKTRHYLREHFEAVSFPYLNKIHLNSRPNAFAFLMGKADSNIPKSPLSVGYPDDFAGQSQCYKNLSNDQFIGFQYQEAGYKTLMSEDYLHAVFTPPYCWGFNNTPVDHYMRPYQLRADNPTYKTPKLEHDIYKGVCRDSFAPQMDYLKDMLNKYPDTPKFTISWFTYLTHENFNGLFRADEYFYNWFRENNQKLNNSYLFVMADHGIRYGEARQTASGEREDNNPVFLMSLPRSLRDNSELASTVRKNSRQLISHYDVYATFADIAAPNRPSNSKTPLLHGSSVLKPLPQPRTCDRLRIPFFYCICDYPTITLPEDGAPGREAAAFMVETMNKVIEGSNYKNVCEHLTVSRTPVVTESYIVEGGGNLSIYKVTYSVSPGDGKFYGLVMQNHTTGEFSSLSRRFPRLNSYAKTAYCANRFGYASYCYCRETKTTNSITTASTPTDIKKVANVLSNILGR